MNLLEELKPYHAHIMAHSQGHGMTDKTASNALVDIWDKWKNIPEVSKQIYGSVKVIPPTDKGCSGCVASAIKDVINWKKHLEGPGRAYHKLVPENKPLKPKKIKPLKPQKVESKEIDPTTLTWAELKKHAVSKGIKVHGKKKAEILKELQ